MNFLKSIFGKKEAIPTPITLSEKQLVQESFALVAPIADKAAEIFYTKLFELDPELRPLFKGDITEQGKKLMAMLAAAVKGLDRLDTLVPVVQDLGRRHVGYGVKDEHYDTVAAALLYTLETGLGERWNNELKDAWVTVYTVLSSTMKAAAKAA
ncbi:globin domain-containing protein [Reichenbachiella agarivorans]|uniref:Globin domain-containing protein n=1 Tax=Reichenbachiella agarivorans TaxID=2979464 RepID=A0ABY6CMX0_9BACT|nr:globin family protein [Reichenbachiella agarivorans]UXP31863.1 globin domain-containing protein [Reichenbachiella agarivorans]